MTQEKRPVAPYVSFKTFLTALDALSNGLPPVLDSSIFPSFSGAAKSQVMVTLKYLHLVLANGSTTSDLAKLAVETDARPAILQDIIRAAYPGLIELAGSNATPAQFESQMRSIAGTGDTFKKSVTFFLQACQYSGISLPQAWTRNRVRATSATAGRRRRVTPPATKVSLESTQSNPRQANEAVNSTAVVLGNGGVVTLTVAANLLTLTPADRTWLFGLIDSFVAFGDGPSPTQPEEVADGIN